MTLEVNPRFRKSGQAVRRRREQRQHWRQMVVAGSCLVGLLAVGVAAWWFVMGASATDPSRESTGTSEEERLQQVELAEPTAALRPRTLLGLQGDPMILRFAESDEGALRRIPGVPGLPTERLGSEGPERIAVLNEPLLVPERRMAIAIPSTSADFAFFQAEQSRGIEEMEVERTKAHPAEEVAAGVERIVEGSDGSWGEALDATDGPDLVSYVDTVIEDTTTVVTVLPESSREALFREEVVVTQVDRSLRDILAGLGLEGTALDNLMTRLEAILTTRVSQGLLDSLPANSLVALRLREGTGASELLQMSLYGPNGEYLISVAHAGGRGFTLSADPWAGVDLRDHSRGSQEVEAATDLRLIDAIYSTAIRAGLPSVMVGETIAMLARSHDLDRFALPGDRLRMLVSAEPGRAGAGLPQMLFVGVEGPSGSLSCYVWPLDSDGALGCFDFAHPSVGATPLASLGNGLLQPVSGAMSSPFGWRMHPIFHETRLHAGVDWAAPIGTPVTAAADGTVSFAGVAGGYGNVIHVDHGNDRQTRYAHLDSFTELGRVGAEVRAGDVIGYVGTTGNSTGPHLHFELRVDGERVDPAENLGHFVVVAAEGAPVDPDGSVEALVNQIIQVESAGNPNARNPLSSATGLGQFISSTWLTMMERYRPDLFSTLDRESILALRTDPTIAREMLRHFARENEAYLLARGHPSTPTNLYLAHFLGAAGADRVLSANSSLMVAQVMPEIVPANPFLANYTIGRLREWSSTKMRYASGISEHQEKAAPVAVAAAPPAALAYRDAVNALIQSL